MSTFLDRLAASQAKSTLNRYGKSVTVKTKTNVTYSTSTGSVTQTTVSQTVKVTVARSALTTIPVLGDAVTISSADYVIEHVRPLYSGEDIATYEFTVSR